MTREVIQAKLACGCYAEWTGERWQVAASSFLCDHKQGDPVDGAPPHGDLLGNEFPTAWAYEQARKARDKWQACAEAAEAELARERDASEEVCRQLDDVRQQLRRDGHGHPSFHVVGCPGCALLVGTAAERDESEGGPGWRNAEPGC